MKARELAVPGGWEITPELRTDSRGAFFEWFTDPEFTEFAGHRLDMRQANCSVSAAGVLRGVHFAQIPPSQAKYVTCLRGWCTTSSSISGWVPRLSANGIRCYSMTNTAERSTFPKALATPSLRWKTIRR